MDKVLDKIKKIMNTEKFDDTNMLIDTDDLPDGISLKDAVILITCITKYGDKLFSTTNFIRSINSTKTSGAEIVGKSWWEVCESQWEVVKSW